MCQDKTGTFIPTETARTVGSTFATNATFPATGSPISIAPYQNVFLSFSTLALSYERNQRKSFSRSDQTDGQTVCACCVWTADIGCTYSEPFRVFFTYICEDVKADYDKAEAMCEPAVPTAAQIE